MKEPEKVEPGIQGRNKGKKGVVSPRVHHVEVWTRRERYEKFEEEKCTFDKKKSKR